MEQSRARSTRHQRRVPVAACLPVFNETHGQPSPPTEGGGCPWHTCCDELIFVGDWSAWRLHAGCHRWLVQPLSKVRSRRYRFGAPSAPYISFPETHVPSVARNGLSPPDMPSSSSLPMDPSPNISGRDGTASLLPLTDKKWLSDFRSGKRSQSRQWQRKT